MPLKKADHSRTQGNVLFLILIAVALFAALSYIVAQSFRSGRGTPEKEQLQLEASNMLQHVVSMRAATLRVITNGATAETVRLHKPGQTYNVCTDEQYCVFDPAKATGINMQLPNDPELDIYGNVWNYLEASDNSTIEGIGTAKPDIVMIRYIKQSARGKALCEALNKQVGIEGIPDNVGSTSTWDGAPGKATACIKHYATFYLFYASLIEN